MCKKQFIVPENLTNILCAKYLITYMMSLLAAVYIVRCHLPFLIIFLWYFVLFFREFFRQRIYIFVCKYALTTTTTKKSVRVWPVVVFCVSILFYPHYKFTTWKDINKLTKFYHFIIIYILLFNLHTSFDKDIEQPLSRSRQCGCGQCVYTRKYEGWRKTKNRGHS